MPDLVSVLADLGAASLDAFWLPVAVWTVLALVVDGGLRLGRANAALGIPLRGALLAALPTSLGLGGLARLAPGAASMIAEVAPIARLPEIVVGAASAPPQLAPSPIGPAVGDVVTGLLVVSIGLAAVVGLGRLVTEAVRLRRLRRDLPPAPSEIQDQLTRAARQLSLSRAVDAVMAPHGVAPFTVGWRRPVVAVPPDLDPAALDAALTHELAHVARSDFAWHVAQRAVTAVFAAHPLVHVLGRGLDLDRERAADAAVLAVHPTRRRAYADLLFSYASLPAPAPAFALSAAPGTSSLKSRIDAMTRPLSPTRFRQFLHLGRALGATGLVLVAGLAVVAAAPERAVPAGTPDVLSVRTVEGVVTDADTGDPLIGANVRVVGTDLGAATDLEGRYRLRNVPDGDQTLQVSFVGYETRTVRLPAGQTEQDIALTTSNVATPDGDVAEIERAMRERVAQRARQARNDPDAPDIFEVAEVQPELTGGLEGLQERVVYPQEAKDEDVEGQVVIQFIVNEEGAVEDARVLRSPDDRLSEAALDAVRASRFTPGRQRGRPVKVRFAVPITFRLPQEDG